MDVNYSIFFCFWMLEKELAQGEAAGGATLLWFQQRLRSAVWRAEKQKASADHVKVLRA